MVFAILLLTSEIYSLTMFISFAFMTLQKCDTSCNTDVKDKAFYPVVDIFICTYNEDLSILKDTFNGCKNIDYPRKNIYVLDDGKRDSVENLAAEYGFNYISREDNTGFKAGNINNALKQTNGELIAVFDADHIPVSTFLNELVDFFMDKKVAVVQTPQHFYNLDPIQKNLGISKYVNNEQDLFFRVLEPSFSCSNATLVAGTNFVIRRKNLEELGGMPEDSITEDINMSIMLEQSGSKVRFYNKPLAVGLSPESFKDYIIQRMRWAKGTIQIFINKKSKNYINKLKITQKIPYYSGLLYYFLDLPRLICLIAPALFLVFGIKPVVVQFWPVMILLQLSYFVFKIKYFTYIAGEYRNILICDLYETTLWAPLLMSKINMFIGQIMKKTEKFQVTNKGSLSISINSSSNFGLIMPNIILLLFCLSGFYEAYIKFNMIPPAALYVNLFWNLYNAVLLTLAICIGIERKDNRKNYRIPVKLNAKFLSH